MVLTIFRPQVFDDGRLGEALLEKVVTAFLGLAYNACQVPNRYKIDRSLAFNVDTAVLASGRFSDLRRGYLGGQLVALKTLRMPGIRKVGYAVFLCSALTSARLS